MRARAVSTLVAGLACGALLSAQSMRPDDQTRDFISRFSVSGQAMIKGFGPATNATVLLTCGGTAQVDSKGSFVLSGATGRGGNNTCEVVVNAPGCEARSIPLLGPAGTVALGPVVLEPLLGKASAGMVSFTSLSQGPEVTRLRKQAREAAASRRYDKAVELLRKAAQTEASNAEVWLALTTAGRAAEALPALEKASGLDALYVPPLVERSVLAMREERWQDAAALAGKAVGINPADFPEAWLYAATAHLKLGNGVAAERAARAALQHATKTKLPKAHHILGVALAQQQRHAEAIEELRAYLKEAPNAPDAATITQHIKLLESEAKK
jgi:cytochrome c-type biogenesis protein CcmH/NrfG